MDTINKMITAEEMARELRCSKPKAYKIIKSCNDELRAQGYITIAGKLPKAYWAKKMYGYRMEEAS